MKKIINGKKYDTATAEKLGFFDNNELGFSSVEETLYRKRTGEFFLLGEGGPMSKYAVSTGGGNWAGGTAIIPLSWESARAWAEEHLDAAAYEAIFGEVTEDDSKTVMSVRISAAALEKAKREASKSGSTLSALVEAAIAAYPC
mgnify:CR=1 FL=1